VFVDQAPAGEPRIVFDAGSQTRISGGIAMRRLSCVLIVFSLLACTVHPAPGLQYETDANGPIWVEPSGHPTPEAHQALALLRHAGDEGLDPVEYDSISLDSLTAA